MFHRAFGFEQGGDIHLVCDAKQACKIKGSKHGLRLFTFRDQHADGRIAVDMMQDLRHGEELPHGGCALNR